MKQRILLLAISSLLFISCSNEFEKNIRKYSDSKIFINNKYDYDFNIVKIDTLSKTDVKLEELKENQKIYIDDIETTLQNITDKKNLIEKIKEAKIVKPNKINLYAIKNDQYGKENIYYEIAWDLPFATTKEKDIAEINKQIKDLNKQIEISKILKAGIEKAINEKSKLNDNSIENYKVHTDFFLDDKLKFKYIFTLDNKKNIKNSKKIL